MSITVDDSQLSRLVVEQKLCTAKELKVVRAELESMLKGGKHESLAGLLVKRGYVTESQVNRLSEGSDSDSLYRPAQQIPGFQILSGAIKELPKRLSENPEFVDRFYREGRAAARLNHPNIVQAYDVGESGGYHYFVMEYIDGQTVYNLLSEGTPMEEAEALRIVSQVATALEHAHAQGLIHRDVKPKNIMLTQSHDVKLADMGLARAMDDYATAAEEAGRAYGTPYYISPEQVRGELHIDSRADVYALGATFYHMVTGGVPFNGSTPSAVMHKHLKEPLVPPDHINDTLSSGIGEIIEVMMAKSPEDRYPSIVEVLQDLQTVSRGEPPYQARTKYDHALLEALATTGEVIVPDSEGDTTITEPEGVATQWVVVLGILLAASLLANVFLLVAR